MTSPVAKVGLLFDSTDIQLADLQIFLEIVRGLNELPSVRGRDVVIPSLAGRHETNRRNDVLPIELRGFAQADATLTGTAAEASYRNNMQTIRTLFASDRERASLHATLEDGSEITIYARPLNIAVPFEIPGAIATISIELEGYGDWEAAGS